MPISRHIFIKIEYHSSELIDDCRATFSFVNQMSEIFVCRAQSRTTAREIQPIKRFIFTKGQIIKQFAGPTTNIIYGSANKRFMPHMIQQVRIRFEPGSAIPMEKEREIEKVSLALLRPELIELIKRSRWLRRRKQILDSTTWLLRDVNLCKGIPNARNKHQTAVVSRIHIGHIHSLEKSSIL
ncbi:hypothetical protein CF150_13958 [Pseudomonas sp. CF150]|nr:hypothetical protein CF150_13958 [Pseudomonas sp. CF150]